MRSSRTKTLTWVAGAMAASLVLLSAGPAQAADPWWFEKMRIGDAHAITKGGGARVLVYDAEIDPTVPDLEGASLEWSTQCEAGEDSAAESYDPTSAATSPDASRGTAMTALVAGQGNGGIVGVAPSAAVLFVAGAPGPEESDHCERPLADLAAQFQAHIVSHSGNYPTDDAQVERLLSDNRVLVAAAGDLEPQLDEPASRLGVVAVGAADQEGYNWTGNAGLRADEEGSTEVPEPNGAYITVLAPGVDVPAGASDDRKWVSGKEVTGTAPATSIVAGALALVKAEYPSATGNQLIQHLIHETGGDEFVFQPTSGFGIVSVTKMLAKDPTGWPDINPLIDTPEDIMAVYPPEIYGKYAGATEVPRPEGTASTDDAEKSAADENDSVAQWPLVVGVGVLVLALMGGLVFWLTRRRRASDDSVQE
ncbi:S8 family serine peptidase [Nocardioides gilvus]|uniref:S8 family serine peptidase n=1 Tax=Nocardioides gilvus TaxID=1735589 RepID=UPI000D748A40|nr:S8 family serine peptidase [Nocardioides gilvus]